ncbi:hypothetical protein B0H11DRAFT_2188268 [Mycena galericulata]|nr:hypothetical protein B0H11DRAFT_2188268 [Mycena galericulata]
MPGTPRRARRKQVWVLALTLETGYQICCGLLYTRAARTSLESVRVEVGTNVEGVHVIRRSGSSNENGTNVPQDVIELSADIVQLAVQISVLLAAAEAEEFEFAGCAVVRPFTKRAGIVTAITARLKNMMLTIVAEKFWFEGFVKSNPRRVASNGAAKQALGKHRSTVAAWQSFRSV